MNNGLFYLGAVAAAALLLRFGWTIRRAFKPGVPARGNTVLFFALVFLLMLALRIGFISFPFEFNPDESQMLSQAMRFRSHPVPWRDVDGTTSGPLNSMLLCVPLWFGAPATWPMARAVAWAENCLTLLCLYGALRSRGRPAEARLALMPAIFFYAFATDSHFVHYSSETLPVLLVSVCLCLLLRDGSAERSSPARMFCLGLAAGAIPFAKLQAAPVGVALVILAFAQLVARRRGAELPARSFWRACAGLGLGAVLVPGVILGVVAASGAFNDFLKSYVLFTSAYLKEPLPLRFLHLIELSVSASDFTFIMADAAVAVGMWLVVRRACKGGPMLGMFQPMGSTLLLGIVTVVCLFVAGRAHPHYLVLLLPVLVVFAGLVFLFGKSVWDGRDSPERVRSQVAVGFQACCALLVLIQVAEVGVYFFNLRTSGALETRAMPSAVSREVRAVSQPGDTLTVWGWMPRYYIETGIAPATRDAISQYAISDGPYRDYFRARYLGDFQQATPTIFIDAVASGAFIWDWTNYPTHESFPELSAFIDRNYTVFKSIQLSPGGPPVRIYLSNQRAAKPGEP